MYSAGDIVSCPCGRDRCYPIDEVADTFYLPFLTAENVFVASFFCFSLIILRSAVPKHLVLTLVASGSEHSGRILWNVSDYIRNITNVIHNCSQNMHWEGCRYLCVENANCFIGYRSTVRWARLATRIAIYAREVAGVPSDNCRHKHRPVAHVHAQW